MGDLSMALEQSLKRSTQSSLKVSLVIYSFLSLSSLLFHLGSKVVVFYFLEIDHPGVVSVFPDEGAKLHTTRSWDFLGLEKDNFIPPDSAWKKARFGEDVIIANVDSGNFSYPLYQQKLICLKLLFLLFDLCPLIVFMVCAERCLAGIKEFCRRRDGSNSVKVEGNLSE